MADIYYPLLSDLITIDQLPEGLSFISDDLNALLSKIYYRNFIAEYSANESVSFYDLDIVILTELLKLDIPGTGLALTLNPDSASMGQSIIPVTVNWRWDLLRYISDFNLLNFSSDSNAYFNLLIDFFTGDDKTFLRTALYTFIEDDFSTDDDQNSDYDFTQTDTSTTIQEDPPAPDDSVEFDPDPDYEDECIIETYYLETFVADLKQKYSSFIISQPLNDDPDTAYDDVTAALLAANLDVYSVVVDLYIVDSTSLDNSLNNIKNLFYDLFKKDAIDLAKEIIIPKLIVTSELSAGLEIPRSALIPLDSNNQVIPGDVKTQLIFDIGAFSFDSTSGFGFDNDLSLSFSPITPKAQIGNTGLTLSFTNAKLDVSRTTNIPEADAAGYPVDFVGLYVQQASIGFNGFGQDDTTNVSASLTATNMLIGTGGISGTIKLEDNGILYRRFGPADDLTKGFSVELDTFELTFKMGTIVSSNISGKLKLPGGFQSGGGPSEIDIDVAIKDSGDFSITAKVV
ncbi:MAG TPA: hypothetical protein VL443_09125, partial [Cyclobacteriaceae bacterium]|nr:hypothetical protein [Cyclobacteriaceae bacterium]